MIICVNIKENRSDNQEWRIQKNLQQWVHKIQDEDKQNNYNTTQHRFRFSELHVYQRD
jgi:hypothetical protein